MSDVEVIHVIQTNLLVRGSGTEGEPFRRITQYWDMRGNLLWEIDPISEILESKIAGVG